MKKLLAILLAALLLAALSVPALASAEPAPAVDPVAADDADMGAPIPAEPGSPAPAASEPAPAGVHSHDGVTFTNSLLSLSFYLTKDCALSELVPLGSLSVPAGRTLELCLNGFQLTADIPISIRGTVNIYNCDGDGVFRLGDETLAVEEGGSLNIVNGTLMGRGTILDIRGSVTMKAGGIIGGSLTGAAVAVKVAGGGSFTMTGGSLIALSPLDAAEGAQVSIRGGHIGMKAMTGAGLTGAIGPGVTLSAEPDQSQLASNVTYYRDTEDTGYYITALAEIDDPTPGPEVQVALAEDGKTAAITGDFEAAGLFARVALVIDNNGVSALLVTQATINPEGTVVIPSFMVPGLRVTGVCIALSGSREDLEGPNPQVIAMDFLLL